MDIPKEDYNKPKYIEFTGDKEMNNILLAIFNNNFDNVPDDIKNKLDKLHSNNTEKDNGNLRGSIVKIIMITQSGSEGISLKNVRQVHITEPYWNKIRIDQVIGRAVRTKSHMELPKNERNINVYQYLCKFSKEQLKDPKVEMLDNSFTTDEVIFNLADRKAKTNDDVLKLLKSSAVDCHLHAKNHINVKCFNYPIDIDNNKLMVQANIEEDDIDIISKDKETKMMVNLSEISAPTDVIFFDGAQRHQVKKTFGGEIGRIAFFQIPTFVSNESRKGIYSGEGWSKAKTLILIFSNKFIYFFKKITNRFLDYIT